ncbi:hypothetical protein DYU11_20945 [Fibrisoma montanum]|uniref:Uncharacterized protein n=1 Tax=Fibrisoma montanum TaxID=2305895 RepID=A0A418M3X5_9BACT|nr:hypothetical protein [Fibrisoma montanum]RIV20515.1 hypothetical protein DYU11_20945 [Fibrisoma montanum]
MRAIVLLLAGLLMGLASFGQVASSTQYGVVKIGTGLSVTNGVLNATGGGGSSVAYQKITATSTIAPTAGYTVISVDNGSTAIAVNLDPASTVGAIVVVKRYDNSSTANVQINATGTAQMQNTLGQFGDGILLPTGGGTRHWGFVWNGSNYEQISQ